MSIIATRTRSLDASSAGLPPRWGWTGVMARWSQKSIVAVAMCVSASTICGSAHAQEAAPSAKVQTEFAPGVVTAIPPAPDPKETFDGPLTLKSIINSHPEIAWQSDNHPNGEPHFEPRSRTLEEMAKQVILRREIFCFEFSFKPLRQMYLDLPRPDGRLQRKLVHYMVYRVRYRGGDLRPAVDDPDNPIYQRIESVSYSSRRFFPMLVLRDHESDRSYVDQILPIARDRIAIREQITAPLHNSVDISTVKIPRTSDESAPGVWGVATWVDVEPGLDFFSIDVFGLTNAFEQDGEGEDAPYRRKALTLNFYRPGDRMDQTEDRVRFGVPAYSDPEEQKYMLDQYGLEQRLDYTWTFR
ncbi:MULTISPECIES: hypothetical protein [Rhodopirellula]|uniref:Putative secreted protein n=1 Tax=Rhodopirellula europaea 6C TaxID=1263867 RepID=M2B616_9BACT|nr:MULTISPECIES: hypothetical protein [Rhodopirellula]EMB17193.1 putative secreted protein [Rhodopirellula europaea 6C]